MKAFSNLLSDLILTSSRNRKISLLAHYFSSTPDPDRGYALAALTGSLNFKNIKASFFKELIKISKLPCAIPGHKIGIKKKNI